MFLNEFDLFISNLHTEKGVLLFCGDFNINWKDQENSSSEQFANILKTYDLLQLVDQETHIKGGLLDLMILDKELLQAATSVETDKSFQTDHYPVKLQLTSDWYLKKNEVIHQSVREFHKFNIELFHLDLENELITDSEYVSTLSLLDAIKLYNSTLSRLLDKQCPLTTKRYRLKHWNSKWYNASLKDLKRKKRIAERIYRKTPNAANKETLRQLRNKYNFNLKETRENFYHQQLTEHSSDARELFSLLRKLTGAEKDKVYPSNNNKEVTAEQMANFYTNKIINIRKNIMDENNNVSVETNSVCNIEPVFTEFTPINHEDLKRILSSMKNKTSREDPIPTSAVRQSFDLLSFILVHIINLAISQGTFPK